MTTRAVYWRFGTRAPGGKQQENLFVNNPRFPTTFGWFRRFASPRRSLFSRPWKRRVLMRWHGVRWREKPKNTGVSSTLQGSSKGLTHFHIKTFTIYDGYDMLVYKGETMFFHSQLMYISAIMRSNKKQDTLSKLSPILRTPLQAYPLSALKSDSEHCVYFFVPSDKSQRID